jgi:hypothetical protein
MGCALEVHEIEVAGEGKVIFDFEIEIPGSAYSFEKVEVLFVAAGGLGMKEIGESPESGFEFGLGSAQALFFGGDLVLETSTFEGVGFPSLLVEFLLPRLLVLVPKPIGLVHFRAEDVGLLVQCNRGIDVRIEMPRLAALDNFVSTVLKNAGIQHERGGKHTPSTDAMNRGFAKGRSEESQLFVGRNTWGD